MLRLVLLALYLAGSLSIFAPTRPAGRQDHLGSRAQARPSTPSDTGGGWDPDGLHAQAPPGTARSRWRPSRSGSTCDTCRAGAAKEIG